MSKETAPRLPLRRVPARVDRGVACNQLAETMSTRRAARRRAVRRLLLYVLLKRGV
jgi:hypothetical protein